MSSSESKCEWEIYDSSGLLTVRAKIIEEGFIRIQLETDGAYGVAAIEDRCWEFSDVLADGSIELESAALLLRLEEIPHLIAILNEVFRAHYPNALREISGSVNAEADQDDGEFADVTSIWSRGEPAPTRVEDREDRLAVLAAFKTFSDNVSEVAEAVGILRPIG